MATTVTRVNVKEKAIQALAQLPPFSPILNRLLASLAQEDVSFSSLGDLIEKDTVLAGNVLRLVNSALYGRRGTVSSVRHAIAILGINKLRNATLGMSIARLWNNIHVPERWSMLRFNLHSIATAILADLTSQVVTVNYPEGAFVAGLFHDLGLLLAVIGLPDEFEEMHRLYLQDGVSWRECEQSVLGLTHAELSVLALTEWNLPEPIRVAARYCEDLESDQTELAPGTIALSRLLGACNDHVIAAGISIDTVVAKREPPHPNALASLGIGERLPRLLEDFDSEFEAIRKFF